MGLLYVVLELYCEADILFFRKFQRICIKMITKYKNLIDSFVNTSN